MKSKKEKYYCPIKGNINHLQSHIESAKSKGAEFYDIYSGSIVFYTEQSDEEYLQEQMNRYINLLKESKIRLREIQARQKQREADENK